MNKFTKISFNIFKFSSLGLILIYIMAVILVGGGGHSVGNFVSFFSIALYSIFIFILIHYYQKSIVSGKRVHLGMKSLFVIFILPTVVITAIFIVTILSNGFRIDSIVVTGILSIFVISGLTILKYVFFG